MSPLAASVARLVAATVLFGLALWWVGVPHSWDGRVVFTITEVHGLHETDWPAFVFGALGLALVFSSPPRRLKPVRVRSGR